MVEDTEYHLLGTPILDEHPTVFELVMEQHVQFVDPVKYGLHIESVDPNDYFVTSGDAIQKTIYMSYQIKNLADKINQACIEREWNKIDRLDTSNTIHPIRLNESNMSQLQEYRRDLMVNYAKSLRLIELLTEAKGSYVFLETEWNNHRLLCIPKNPRKAAI